ncbi:MAG: glycosyltransferase family 4 protein [Verrucomicrobiota bacterium]
MRETLNNRIVHVPRRFVAEEWGGTETVILEISRQQQQAGESPEILTSMALAKRREEEIGGVPVRRFSYSYPYFGLSQADRAAMDKKGGNLLSLSLFASLLTRPNVRLFHAHTLKRLGGEVLTAARLRRKPFVVSLHGGVFDVPSAELQQLIAPIQGKLEWGRIFGAVFGSRRVLESADQVICVGQSETAKAAEQIGHDRVAYLPNGVDCTKFATGDGVDFRRKHSIPAGALLVLNISRIDAQKNQRLLLEAFACFRARQANAFLVLIGPETQPEYAASLREFIATSNLGDCVRMLPGLRNDSADLVNAYHASDVFVLPSRHEPFGIVVLEAWSAGRPVIVNHVGGLKALVRHGGNGLFINPASEATTLDLAEQLQLLATAPALRQKLGHAGRDEARSHYDWSRIAQKLEDLYQAAERHAACRYGRRSA